MHLCQPLTLKLPLNNVLSAFFVAHSGSESCYLGEEGAAVKAL